MEGVLFLGKRKKDEMLFIQLVKHYSSPLHRFLWRMRLIVGSQLPHTRSHSLSQSIYATQYWVPLINQFHTYPFSRTCICGNSLTRFTRMLTIWKHFWMSILRNDMHIRFSLAMCSNNIWILHSSNFYNLIKDSTRDS